MMSRIASIDGTEPPGEWIQSAISARGSSVESASSCVISSVPLSSSRAPSSTSTRSWNSARRASGPNCRMGLSSLMPHSICRSAPSRTGFCRGRLCPERMRADVGSPVASASELFTEPPGRMLVGAASAQGGLGWGWGWVGSGSEGESAPVGDAVTDPEADRDQPGQGDTEDPGQHRGRGPCGGGGEGAGAFRDQAVALGEIGGSDFELVPARCEITRAVRDRGGSRREFADAEVEVAGTRTAARRRRRRACSRRRSGGSRPR